MLINKNLICLIFQDPLCLEDCQKPCIKSLINDYKTAGGVCAGSYNFGGDPISPIPCVGSYSDITQGLCSEETERLLLEEECREYVWFNNEKFYGTRISGR